jgi:hypothetical protein
MGADLLPAFHIAAAACMSPQAFGIMPVSSPQYIACLHLDCLVHKPCALINDLACAQRIVPDLQYVLSSGQGPTGHACLPAKG